MELNNMVSPNNGLVLLRNLIFLCLDQVDASNDGDASNKNGKYFLNWRLMDSNMFVKCLQLLPDDGQAKNTTCSY